jgi:Zn-dependent protease with chaperone function
MPFLILLFLSIIIIVDWQQPAWTAGTGHALWLPAVLTLAGVAALIAAAAVIARAACRAARRNPEGRRRIRQRYILARQAHFVATCLAFGFILYSIGWGWLVQTWCKDLSALAAVMDLIILAPFFVALFGSWCCFYDAEEALRSRVTDGGGRTWSRWGYADFQLRLNLALVAAPLALLIALKFLLRVYSDEWLHISAAVILTLVVFVGQPWILRLVLRLRPLEEGPLRRRLMLAADRLGFRCGGILVWDTRGGIVNAMVAGLAPYPRYVMMTDRLMEQLSPDEIEAVFGHEIGHIKHGHIPYYAVFLLGCMFASAGVANLMISSIPLLRQANEVNEFAVLLPLQLLLLANVFLVFGFLSRRCERQADIFGARAVSCDDPRCVGHAPDTKLADSGRALCPTGIATFVSALEKVADLNGICRDKPGWMLSWRHSTIARRVDFLRQLGTAPGLESEFQSTVGRVKWALVLGLAVVLIGLAAVQWWTELPYVWQLVTRVRV